MTAIKILFLVAFGYIIGTYVVGGNYKSILLPFGILLLFVPRFPLLLLCFIAIQVSPNKNFELLALGSMEFYYWDFIIVLLIIKLGGPFLLRGRRIISSPLNNWIYALFAWSIVSSIYGGYMFGSENFYFAMTSLVRTLSMVSLFFLVGTIVDSKEKIQIFLKLLLFCVLFQVTLAIIQRVGGLTGFTLPMEIFSPDKGAYWSIDFRSAGTYGSFGFLGQGILLCIFPAIMLIYEKRMPVIKWLILSFALLGILLSGSKGPFLGAFALIFMVLAEGRKGKLGFAFKVILVGGVAIFLTKDYIVHRITSEFLEFDFVNQTFLWDPDSSTLSRIALWKASIPIFFESPIFGYGWCGAALTSLETGLHCLYVEVLVDLGIPGAFIFFFLLVYILRLLYSLRNITNDPFFILLSKSMLPCFIAFYIAMLGSPTLVTGNPITGVFWGLVGLAMSARRIALKERMSTKLG